MLIIFVDVVRFEAKSVTSKRLIMRRIAFYPVGGERVSLPERHIKAYVDDYCHEFGQTDTDTKLMHLLYVADKGFDILSHIREFLDNHPEIADKIQYAYCPERYEVLWKQNEIKRFAT